MPYLNQAQTKDFVQTADHSRNLVDKHAALAPVHLESPVCSYLEVLDYRSDGFNSHDKIVFDFLAADNYVNSDLYY